MPFIKGYKKKSGLGTIPKAAIGIGASTLILGTSANIAAGTGTTAGAHGARALQNVAGALPAAGTIIGAGATIGLLRSLEPKKRKR